MANYNGVLNSGVFVDNSLICSQTIQNQDKDAPTLKTPVSSVPLIGNSQQTYVDIGMNATAEIGTKVETFLDDYYYRIHLNPLVIPLGPVLAPINQEFILWNSWFVSKTFTAINKTNPAEFVLTGQAAPYTMQGLEYLDYEIDVPKDGSVEILSTITFDFASELPVLIITGTRIITFGWEPLVGMTEKLSWLTQILKGKSGKEQRISLRYIPRQFFNLAVFLSTEQRQATFESAIFTWQKLIWGVPVWAEWVEHSTTITAGAMSITIDTTFADFRDESMALIYQDQDNFEIIKIDTKTDSVLNLEAPVQSTYSGTKVIMPVRIMQMPTSIKGRQAADGFSHINCQFLATDNIELTGFTADETYKGNTVLTAATYTDGTQEIDHNAEITIVDSGTGKFNIFSDSDYNVVTQSHIFKNYTKEECWNYRLFLHSLKGRQGLVWIPTFKADLVQTQFIGQAETTFTIDNIGLADNMGLNSLRTDLAFIFPDGTNIYREITGITESGSEEIVSIDTSLGVDVSIGDCEICFLDKYRLASDEVEIKWIKCFKNESRLNFVRIEQ